MAGEQIDALFGARMGLTMMASAGFGNLVADVVGVSATRTVQENIKRVSWATPPRLRCAGWLLCCCTACLPSPGLAMPGCSHCCSRNCMDGIGSVGGVGTLAKLHTNSGP